MATGKAWTEQSVRGVRKHHDVAAHRDGEWADRGEITLDAAAKIIGVCKMTALHMLRRGDIIAASPGIAMEVFSACADVVIPLEALRQAVLEVLRDKLRTWRRRPFRKERRLALAARHLSPSAAGSRAMPSPRGG